MGEATLTLLEHGYDEERTPEQWRVDDFKDAAAFRGGTCEATHMNGPHEPVSWRCAAGHTFSMTPNLMLRGGH